MALPKTMLACRVVKFNAPLSLTTIPVPTPSPTELLIRIHSASLCSTDFMVQDGLWPSPLPMTASHEAAGVIVALGSDVKDTEWKIGDRVMAPTQTGHCGRCVDCQGPEEWQFYCTAMKHRGVHLDGGFAEYMLIDADKTVRLPDAVSFEVAAPLACAGRTSYRAIHLPQLPPGSTLLINGAGGGLGHLGIQFALLTGHRVIALDIRPEALELCRRLGAHLVLDASLPLEELRSAVQDFVTSGQSRKIADVNADAEGNDSAPSPQMRMHAGSANPLPSVLPGFGADASINFSADASSPALTARLTKSHGMLVQVAVPHGCADVSVPMREMLIRDVSVRGTMVCSRQESEEMLELVAKGGVEVVRRVVRGLENVEGVGGMVERARREEKGGGVGKWVVLIGGEGKGERARI